MATDIQRHALGLHGKHPLEAPRVLAELARLRVEREPLPELKLRTETPRR